MSIEDDAEAVRHVIGQVADNPRTPAAARDVIVAWFERYLHPDEWKIYDLADSLINALHKARCEIFPVNEDGDVDDGTRACCLSRSHLCTSRQETWCPTHDGPCCDARADCASGSG